MSFSTRTMRGTTETSQPVQIRVDNPYDLLHKTATPQLLPTMLRLNTSASAPLGTCSTLRPAQVQITVAPTTQHLASVLPAGGSLFPSNILNQTTSRVAEPEADWRTHALLSQIPELSARLTNLDKEIRVPETKAADATQQVLRMHNAVLESHDTGIEQQKTSTRATMQRCDDLHAQHVRHTSSTRQYLTQNQDILEAHEERIADLHVAHEAHAERNKEAMELLDVTHDVLASHDTSIDALHELHETHAEQLLGMATKAEASQEYLTLAQGILEAHDDSIQALHEATRTNAQLLKQLSYKTKTNAGTDDNTMQYLKLNQGMMETFHRSIDDLTQTSQTHAKLLSGHSNASLESKLNAQDVEISALRSSLHQVHDELDALHGR